MTWLTLGATKQGIMSVQHDETSIDRDEERERDMLSYMREETTMKLVVQMVTQSRREAKGVKDMQTVLFWISCHFCNFKVTTQYIYIYIFNWMQIITNSQLDSIFFFLISSILGNLQNDQRSITISCTDYHINICKIFHVDKLSVKSPTSTPLYYWIK